MNVNSMAHSLRLVLVSLAFPCISLCQESAGMYVVKQCDKKNEGENAFVWDKVRKCVPRQPVVSSREFIRVSAMEGNNPIHFDLLLSTKGHTTLQRLCESFPEAEIALVINNFPLAVFPCKDQRIYPTLRIYAFTDMLLYINAYQKLTQLVEAQPEAK